jgi:hypothetical protein
VTDIADFCSLERGQRHIVRLAPGLTGWLGERETAVHEAVAEWVAAETTLDPEIGIDAERWVAADAALRTLLADCDHPLVTVFRGRYETHQS